MNLTNIITSEHIISNYLVIVDQDNNPISRIQSYNIETKEAVRVVTGPDGRIVTKWEHGEAKR
jgi:hypothetical protein